MKRLKLYVFVTLLFTLIVGAFFATLFYPDPQLLLNPEYGRSDISHFNIPVRYIYDQALTQNQIPLWTKDIDTGFPIFAESQMGAYFLPNYLVYKLLPFWMAFNLSYVLAFVIGAVGMFAFIKLKFSNVYMSFLMGLIYVFSGYFVAHTNHINMLQTAALVPWILYVFEMFRRKSWSGYIVFFSLLLSQQIFAGHLQTSFITGVLLIVYACISTQDISKKSLHRLFKDLSFIVLGFASAFVLSSVQVLPSYELHSQSVRSETFSLDQTTLFSFHPRSLLTMIHPEVLGSLKDGSYEFLQGILKHGNIYWETNAYIPLIGFVLLLGSLLFIKRKNVQRYGIIMICGMLLMFGSHSPFYFIFSIPPFNIFTTPARFLLMFLIGVILIVTASVENMSEYVSKKKINTALVIMTLLTLGSIFYVWYPYGVRISKDSYFSPPSTANFVKEQVLPKGELRVMNIESGTWSKEFNASGWSIGGNGYAQYFNELNTNMNVLWGVPHYRSYVGRIWTQRKFLYDQLISGIVSTNTTDVLLAQKLLAISSTDYVIAAAGILPEGMYKDVYIEPATSIAPEYHVYHNDQAIPRIRLVDKVIKVESVEDILEDVVSQERLDTVAYVEDDVNLATSDDPIEYNVTLEDDSDMSLTVSYSSNKEAMLVIADLYYPGWNVFIDDEKADYYPVNIIQRGVVVPKGNHKVRMEYAPDTYARGLGVTKAAHIIALLAVFQFLLEVRQASLAKKQ